MISRQFVRTAFETGCPKDQIKNFVQAGITLQPRQLEASAAARQCDDPKGFTAIGYGGARGGGKSHWLLAQMGADDCQRRPGLKCLLLRKVGKSNYEQFEDFRTRLFGSLRHDFSVQRRTLTFANGSKIIAGHFQSESDVDAYLGLEYDVIGIEEATTLSERKYLDITTCCRSSKPDFRPRIYSTTNPGGVGHIWYKKLFVTPHFTRLAKGVSPFAPQEIQTNNVPKTCFIPARVTDNSFTDPDYPARLAALTGWQKRAWLDGDWDIAAGQFFSHFRRDAHVISHFDPLSAHEWFAALDYGFTHYTAVVLGCKDGDGKIYIIDEHAQRQWLPKQHVDGIRAMLRRNGLRDDDLARFVAGADVFSTTPTGTTIAKQYSDLGFFLRRANMDRVNGWAELLRRFGDPDAGIKPTLFIHQRCSRLIETITSLQHDPAHPEDVLKVDVDEEGKGGDDTADALRYLVHTKIPETRVVKLGW